MDSLRLEGVNQVDFTWTPQPDGLGFEVQLPRKLGPTDSGAVLEVVFKAPVLREVGTFFDGRVFDSAKPHEVRQQIEPGNAADEAEERTAFGAHLSGAFLAVRAAGFPPASSPPTTMPSTR